MTEAVAAQGPVRRKWGPAAFAVLVVSTLVGCSSDAEAEGSRDEPLSSDIPEGVEIGIADQHQRLQYAFQESGELDQFEFSVEFGNFDGGPAVLEALRSGQVQVGTVGDGPPIHAASIGEDAPIIAAYQTEGTQSFVTSPESDVETIDDIAGSRVAYSEGTATGAALLEGLANIGLSPDDVELVPLPNPEIPEALQASEVDVAPQGEPRLTRYLTDYADSGAKQLEEDEVQDLGSGLSFLYARGDALDDPDTAAALGGLVEHYIRAFHWANENPDIWIDEYLIGNQNLEEDEAERVLDDQGDYTFPKLDGDLAAQLQEVIDLLEGAGELEEGEALAEDIIDYRFNDVVESTVEDIGAQHDRSEVSD